MRLFKPTQVVLAMLCVMYFITYVDRVNIGTAASEIQKELHLSNTQLGLVFSAFAYPYLLFQVIGGWVGDRFGPRRTLFWCGLIWAVSTIATGFVTSLMTLFIARVALGFGEGATFPTATRAMQYWTPAGKRGFAQGLTHAFARLGNAATPPARCGTPAAASPISTPDNAPIKVSSLHSPRWPMRNTFPATLLRPEPSDML